MREIVSQSRFYVGKRDPSIPPTPDAPVKDIINHIRVLVNEIEKEPSASAVIVVPVPEERGSGLKNIPILLEGAGRVMFHCQFDYKGELVSDLNVCSVDTGKQISIDYPTLIWLMSAASGFVHGVSHYRAPDEMSPAQFLTKHHGKESRLFSQLTRDMANTLSEVLEYAVNREISDLEGYRNIRKLYCFLTVRGICEPYLLLENIKSLINNIDQSTVSLNTSSKNESS